MTKQFPNSSVIRQKSKGDAGSPPHSDKFNEKQSLLTQENCTAVVPALGSMSTLDPARDIGATLRIGSAAGGAIHRPDCFLNGHDCYCFDSKEEFHASSCL